MPRFKSGCCPYFTIRLSRVACCFSDLRKPLAILGDLFEVVDKRWKIYRRKELARPIYPVLEFSAGSWRDNREARQVEAFAAPKDSNVVSSVERLLLSRFAPASVVINDRGDALYFHGRTGAYLEPAVGKPRLNILDMAREGLQLELSAALRHAARLNGEVVRDILRVKAIGARILLGRHA